ncbi:hypothetical protein ABD77_07015 [Brevibacillus formosus]|nr:hypothetical protein [Brevibacillus formosus]
MIKSFYNSAPWSTANSIRQKLLSMEIPFVVEQESDLLQLKPGEVAFVFPDVHVRVYNSIREIFNSHGLRYPQ